MLGPKGRCGSGRGRVSSQLVLKDYPRLFFVEILSGYVILENFAGADFLSIRVVGVFDAGNYARLKSISFFEEFIDAFGVRSLQVRQALKITCLGV